MQKEDECRREKMAIKMRKGKITVDGKQVAIKKTKGKDMSTWSK